MRAHYRTKTGQITIEVEGEKVRDIFAKIANVQEIFEAESHCGLCGSTNIRFQHRTVEKYKYYEMACNEPKCNSRFQFGQSREGGELFPKRRGESGSDLPNRGWSKWDGKKDKVACLTK